MCSKSLGLALAMFVLYFLIEPQHAVPEVVKKQVKKVHVRCMNQTGVVEETIVAAHKGLTLPNDPAFKCFLHCMFEMFGLIDSEHVMHMDALLDVLPEETHPTIKNMIETCGTIKGIDGCDTAFQSVKCYIDVEGPFIKSAVDDLLG
ncbi:general odorant-binding protein 69a isoform X2 [Drosophila innubila]|uniref:general odorant-binding protein 69a isoform X2 n=1 Tax=Drosophila innubila TaxID=198719 RepID=UPI00148C15FE|nr:general odorant-binding protein 69a isoform X2 [Drosophila innubila]